MSAPFYPYHTQIWTFGIGADDSQIALPATDTWTAIGDNEFLCQGAFTFDTGNGNDLWQRVQGWMWQIAPSTVDFRLRDVTNSLSLVEWSSVLGAPPFWQSGYWPFTSGSNALSNFPAGDARIQFQMKTTTSGITWRCVAWEYINWL